MKVTGMTRGRTALVAALAIGVLAAIVHAATPREIVIWYQQAQVLERAGDVARAADLYRRVWEADPRRIDAAARGATLLAAMHRQVEAARLLDAAIARTPDSPLLWIAYGEIHDRAGDIARADSTWVRAVTTAHEPLPVYLGIIDYLIERGAPDRAERWTERGLAATGGNSSFSRRLFDIALVRRDYYAAARHAAHYASSTRDNVSDLAARLGDAELPPGARDSIAVILRGASDADTSSAGIALLAAELALATGDARAAEVLSARAARSALDLGELIELAGRLESRGLLVAAARVHEVIVERFPLAPQAPRSARMAADRAASAGESTRAERLYRYLLDRGGAQYEDDARIALGGLALGRGAVDEAAALFEDAARRGRTDIVRRRGSFGLAEVAFRRGNLAEADQRWTELAESGANPDAGDARLRLADLAMYRGDAVALGARCEELMAAAPRSEEANDCLALVAVLSDAERDTAVWRSYGHLRYLLDRGALDSVRVGVAALNGTPLAGHGQLLAAEATVRAGDAAGGADAYAAIAERFDGTPIGEEALWRLGEIVRTVLGDRQRALGAYERLLRTYPESVYNAPARRWVRRLRAESGAT